MVRVVVALCFVLTSTGLATAQQKEPVGPFVVDARGLVAGLPTSEGWVPTLPTGTVVPSRGFGLDVGGHVYPVQWGPARIGFGGAVTFARGTATATVEGTPDVVSRSSTVAPQVSFNFGHRLGWSHLSLGYGVAKVSSEATAAGLQPAETVDPGWAGALNFGGGARWFVTDHLGVGFEARWHRLGSRAATATSVGAPGVTLFHLAVGLSVH
jgi:hypothetical protein